MREREDRRAAKKKFENVNDSRLTAAQIYRKENQKIDKRNARSRVEAGKGRLTIRDFWVILNAIFIDILL